MKILCWNINDSVWQHWCNLLGADATLTRVDTLAQADQLLTNSEYDYCFIYLDDSEFSTKVENVVMLRKKYKALKIIAFPFLRSQTAGIRMLSAGVNAQCSPFVKADQLALIMAAVDSGEIWGGKEFIQNLIEQSARSLDEFEEPEEVHFSELSERENSVANFVAKGLSNKHIAKEMDITERTVKAHLTAIYKKLNAKDRLSLALLVQQHLKQGSSLGGGSGTTREGV